MVFFSLCSLAKRLPCYRIHVEQSIAYVSLYEYTASALDVLMLSTGEDVNDAIGTSVAVTLGAISASTPHSAGIFALGLNDSFVFK